MGTNTLTVILFVLSVLNVIAVCFLTVKVIKSGKYSLRNATVHYTLYIGTNDKSTYGQIIPTDDAKRIISEICARYVNGFTIHDASGRWNDEKGNTTCEDTIVCYLDDIDEEMIHSICDQIRTALNQNGVLIQKEYTHLEFFKGN